VIVLTVATGTAAASDTKSICEGARLVRGIENVSRHQSRRRSEGRDHFQKGQYICPIFARRSEDGKPTRVGFKFLGEGVTRRKVRIAQAIGRSDRW